MSTIHRLFRRRLLRVAVTALALVSLVGAPAAADDYDAYRAGHPLRILAYILHPVGVALDYLIMRPAHWIGSQEPMDTIVGHEQTDFERREHAAEVHPAEVPRRNEGPTVPPSTGFDRRP